jgi:beta-lactamase class A
MVLLSAGSRERGNDLRGREAFSALRIISILLILAAIILTIFQLLQYSRVRAFLPRELKIASVDVGGLDRPQAAQQLSEVYSVPVDIRYKGEAIHLNPGVVDFQLDMESMLAAADLERTEQPFWEGFINYMWGRSTTPQEIPLRASYSEARLRDFLNDIALRYDQPAIAATPIQGSVNFESGKPGTALDPEGAVLLIENALYSISNRMLDLPLKRIEPSRPAFENLETLLKQTIDSSELEGLTGIYLLDLKSNKELHFAVQNGEDVPVQPDIAFSASSIIKLPIMVSSFRRIDDTSDSETMKLMEDVITKSGNESADWLMEREIDQTRGPLIVSEDMQELGLANTFLAGYFTLGSPLLAVVETPANQRTDINTDPDPYSQTTPSDMGMLLEDIYQCSKEGGSALIAAFPEEITQQECQYMNTLLINNRLPLLLTAGLPEGTQIAHKHGWVTTNGVINTIGDAGIVYTLGGDYVLVVFLHNPEQLIWDPASLLVAELSRAVYNYYNLPGQ